MAPHLNMSTTNKENVSVKTVENNTASSDALLQQLARELRELRSQSDTAPVNIDEYSRKHYGIPGEAMLRLLKKHNGFFTSYGGIYLARASTISDCYTKDLNLRAVTQQKRRDKAITNSIANKVNKLVSAVQTLQALPQGATPDYSGLKQQLRLSLGDLDFLRKLDLDKLSTLDKNGLEAQLEKLVREAKNGGQL